MKIINSVVVVLMILVCGSQFSHGVTLNCEFQDVEYGFFGSLYSCDVTSLDNPHNNLTIDGYLGEHKMNKNDADVNAIWIHDTNTKYIPTNLGTLFNLTALSMVNTQLVEIKAKDFLGMQDLEFLSFYSNKLSSVPLDAFATLTKLRLNDLSFNQIEELSYGIFGNNLEMERIYLQFNKIKNLGIEIFHGHKKLNYVDLRGNICVSKYYNGATEINQLKNDIKMKCDIPNYAIDFKLNEIMRQQLNAINVQQKDRDVIDKLRIELTEAKDAEQKMAIELNNLKQELRECKELQQPNEDTLKELREAKDLQKTNKAETLKERDVKDDNQKDLNKILKQLLNAIDVEKKDRVEKEKLKTELSEATKLQQNCEAALAKTQDLTTKLYNCTNEDALKKELRESKEQKENCESSLEKAMKSSFNIVCEFQMTVEGYSCDARDLVINQKQMELNEVSGTHLMSKTNENVTELKIANSSMLFWSNDIFKTFPGLQTLIIHKAQLKELSQGDFNSATNLKNLKVQGNVIRVLGDDLFQGAAEHLTNIDMNSNEIVKISTGTFHGLKQLKMLSLKDNLITELQLGTFKDVVMLENLFLSGNKIKFLNGKLFEFNVKLMTLAVDHNELREIGEDILDYSVALKDVDFNGNDCIYHDFKGSEWGIDDLKFNIKHCCKNQAQALNVYNCGHRGWD